MITRISTIFFAIAFVILMSASTANAVTDFGVNGVNDDVTNSRHNLGSGGATAWYATSSTSEVCVFCHTPHGANMADMHSAPLWNRDLRAGSAYKLHAMGMGPDPSSTTGGMMMIKGNADYDDDFADVSEGSIACLSCHDGVAAIDVMINAPGSGWGAGTGSATDQNWVFTGETANYNADGTFTSGSVRNLGTNLMDDHPISIIYGGWVDGDCYDGRPEYGFRKCVDSIYTGWNVVDSNGDTTAIQLYSRDADEFDGSSGGKVGSVECGSCHNPHMATTTDANGNDSLFLRMGSNAGSKTCLVCHIK